MRGYAAKEVIFGVDASMRCVNDLTNVVEVTMGPKCRGAVVAATRARAEEEQQHRQSSDGGRGEAEARVRAEEQLQHGQSSIGGIGEAEEKARAELHRGPNQGMGSGEAAGRAELHELHQLHPSACGSSWSVR
ncbi:hypothetical protein ZWY2020_049848 [Hordeum vulgare]|nr:hypothetical protein ZWY2020_049848 [Hordeum vulgare]